MGKLVNSSGEEIFVFPGSVGIDSLPEERLTVAGNISSTGNLSAGDIVGTWRGTTLSSSQVTVDSSDLKAYDVTEGLFLKSLGDGSVSWGSISSSSASSTIGTIENTVTIQGDITATGDLHATNIFASNSFVSAGQDLLDIFATSSGNLEGSGTANTLTKFVDSSTVGDSIIRETGSRAIVGGSLSATGLLDVDGNTTILGNLSVHGDMHYIDTNVTVTSALSVVNSGTGPALYVQQKGSQPIAHFVDANGDDIVFSDNGYVGIGIPLATLAGGGTTPQERLTVSGNISALGALSATGSGDNYFAGKVGIGTVAPEEKLSVDGDIQLTNQKQITWADIGDGNTGRVRIVGNEDSDVISFHVDNSTTNAMYLNTTGLGIGTASPAEKLTVHGNISASGSLSAAGPGYNYLEARLGINTNKPDYMLDVAGSIGVGACLIHNGDDDTFIYFTDDDINIQAGGVNFIDITQDTVSEITFNEAGADVDFRVEGAADNGLLYTDAGTDKVGIGTRSPAEKLTVAGNISAANSICTAATTNGFVSAGRDLADIFSTGGGTIGGSGTVDYLPIWCGSTGLTNSILRQHSSGLSAFGGLSASGDVNYFAGNVGIGTYKPSSLLNLNDANNGDAHQLTFSYESGGTKTDAFTIGRNSSTGNLEFQSDINNHGFEFCHAAAGTQEFNVINMDVGIGTNAPNEKLTVAGTISALGALSATGGVHVPDSGKITAGNHKDLQIYHNGTHSFVTAEDGPGSLYIRPGSGNTVQIEDKSGNDMITASTAAAVNLFYNASKKLGTTNTGVGIFGSLSAANSICTAATTNGFVSAGRDLADIFETCASSVDGSGTANYIPLWSDSDTLDNS